METGYGIKNVTEDLNFLLSLTKIFGADDQNFWYDIDQKKRYVYQIDPSEPGKELVNFQDPMPKGNYYYFNPFSEGFGKKTPASSFYYRLIRIAANLNLRTALLYTAGEVLASKKAVDSKEEYTLSHIVVRMSSVKIDKKQSIYDVVDDKMIDEFRDLFDRMQDECIHVMYKNTIMTAEITCAALTDSGWDEKYGKNIRKKSLQAFKAVLMGVLGLTKPEDLHDFAVKYDSDWKSSAQLHTRMAVYLKFYTRFNDILAAAFGTDGTPSTRNEIDLGELAAVIERFPHAYAIAKHVVQPAFPKGSPTTLDAADTSTLRIVNDNGSSRTGNRFAPEVLDNFGNRNRSVPTLGFGSQNSGNRFQPQVLNDNPTDPFSPVVRPAPSTAFGSSQMGGMTQSSYFGTGMGGGLDLNPPSNFGTPGTRSRYF